MRILKSYNHSTIPRFQDYRIIIQSHDYALEVMLNAMISASWNLKIMVVLRMLYSQDSHVDIKSFHPDYAVIPCIPAFLNPEILGFLCTVNPGWVAHRII